MNRLPNEYCANVLPNAVSTQRTENIGLYRKMSSGIYLNLKRFRIIVKPKKANGRITISKPSNPVGIASRQVELVKPVRKFSRLQIALQPMAENLSF
uniref:MSP domain-containing protein n=1 Tax=Caenorhabditis tropicalis TaxID=1561998 RepID=A0A1I7V1U7_9PELO